MSPNKPNSSSGRALGGGDPGAVGRTGQGGQSWVCFIFFPHCDLEAAFKIKFSLRLSLGKAVFLLMLTCPGSDLSSFPPVILPPGARPVGISHTSPSREQEAGKQLFIF